MFFIVLIVAGTYITDTRFHVIQCSL